jgi:DNA-binding protein HU-beta
MPEIQIGRAVFTATPCICRGDVALAFKKPHKIRVFKNHGLRYRWRRPIRAKEKNMADEKVAIPKAASPKVLTVPLSKLAGELAEKHELSKKAVGALMADFIDMTTKHLKKGNKVRITGLGILQVRKRAARLGRNPATGEQIKIKASKKVAFRASKELKEAV